MKITYEIKSRGLLIVYYGDKVVEIFGELIFDPPTFYADLNSLDSWQAPNDKVTLSDEVKDEIVKFLSCQVGPTKIIFD